MNLAMFLPRSSILSKLFYEKTKFQDERVEDKLLLNSDRCIYERSLKLMDFFKKDNIYVMTRIECKFQKFKISFNYII